MKLASTKLNLSPDHFAQQLCSKEFGADLGKVGCKFVSSMVVGIHRTRSVNLTDIAKGLDEHIKLHATQKRLSRNLDDPILMDNLSSRLLALGASKVQPETRLIVHLYELNKKYARKTEFLSKPKDETGAGFKVCEILANTPGSESCIPLLATVWSDQVPGYVSDSDEVGKSVRRVLAATGNKGVLYFDDQSLQGGALHPFLEDPSLDFLALVRGQDLEVTYRRKMYSMRKLLASVETTYEKTLYQRVSKRVSDALRVSPDLSLRAGAVAIKLATSERPLSLIALKSESAYLGETVTPMITSLTNLRSRDSLTGPVEAFLAIQQGLEAHLTLLASFNPANFRVHSYNRLQLLMTLVQAVIHYEVSMVGQVSSSESQEITDLVISAPYKKENLEKAY
jgi:hypothetical protein